MADSFKDLQLRELKDMINDLKKMIKTLQATVDAANKRVENGGFGAQAAAPVARQLIDYWLTGANSLELPPPKGVPLITQRRNR